MAETEFQFSHLVQYPIFLNNMTHCFHYLTSYCIHVTMPHFSSLHVGNFVIGLYQSVYLQHSASCLEHNQIYCYGENGACFFCKWNHQVMITYRMLQWKGKPLPRETNFLFCFVCFCLPRGIWPKHSSAVPIMLWKVTLVYRKITFE